MQSVQFLGSDVRFKNEVMLDLERQLASERSWNDRIKTVKDILRIEARPETTRMDHFHFSIDDYIHQLFQCVETNRLKALEDKLGDECENLGDTYLEKGETEKALALWRKALQLRYNTLTTRKILGPPVEKPGSQTPVIGSGATTSQYLFEYCGSFGSKYLKRPTYFLTDMANNRIVVTDYINHKTSFFDMKGAYIGELEQRLAAPSGIFKDQDGVTWICEFGRARLVSLDRNNQTDQIIDVNDLLEASSQTNRPVYGVSWDDNIFLVLYDDSGTDSKLIKTQLVSSPQTRMVQQSLAGSLLHPTIHQNCLYLGDYYSSAIFRLLKSEHRLVPTDQEFSHCPLNSIAFWGDSLFIAAGGKIIKSDLEEGVLFSADLVEQTGKESLPVHIEILEERGKCYLLACDLKQACIHIFLIANQNATTAIQ